MRGKRRKREKKVATIYSIRACTVARGRGGMNLSSVDLSGRFAGALKSARIAVNIRVVVVYR